MSITTASEQGLGKVDDAVLGQDLEVVVFARLLRLAKEVVLLDLARDGEMRRVEAAVACTGHLGADHPREQDAVARMGEDDVVGKTVIERELLLAHLVGGDGDRPCNLPAVAGVLQMVGELDAHRIRERHDQYPFVRPGALALSVSCWRQRATVPVRLLRFSSRCVNTCSRVILRRIARIALVLVGAGADVLGLLLGQADDLLLAAMVSACCSASATMESA